MIYVPKWKHGDDHPAKKTSNNSEKSQSCKNYLCSYAILVGGFNPFEKY